MGGVEQPGFLRGSDPRLLECQPGSAARLPLAPSGEAPPLAVGGQLRAWERRRAEMPHFTVVRVEDKHRTDYDNLEGLSWVDYSEPGGAAQPDAYDTVSSDGELGRAEASGGPGVFSSGVARCPPPLSRAEPGARELRQRRCRRPRSMCRVAGAARGKGQPRGSHRSCRDLLWTSSAGG